MIRGATIVALAAGAAGHGMLTRPISRSLRLALAESGAPPPLIRGGSGDIAKDGWAAAGGCVGHACEWYTQWTTVPSEIGTTNCDPEMRTMGVSCENNHGPAGSITDWPCTPGLEVPWCAPGYAPVKSPCGIFAGGYDQDARDMLDLDDTPSAIWTAGAVVNVSWAVTANHGGGYAYRLCPHSNPGGMTEECFEKHHLEYVGEYQTILDQSGKVLAQMPARRLSRGTNPPGSTWTRNPFPQEKELKPSVPGLPDAFGRGPFSYNTVDQVKVPDDLAPGAYALSFRWDAEQTKQVWQACSDVLVISKDEPVPALPVPPPLSHGKSCTGISIGLDTSDCEAWIDFYDALDGANWPTEWSKGCGSLRTDPCGCVPDWRKSIICEFGRDFGHITELYLLGKYPSGQIPSTFTQLTHLSALSLVNTSITGTLPVNMGDMASLSMIWLDHNPLLGGEIPQSLSKLANISVIEAHHSGFEGKLPTGIAYEKIPDCTLNGLVFDCPLPAGAATCGAACK